MKSTRRFCLALGLWSVAASAEPSPFEFPLPDGFVSLKEAGGVPPMTRIEDHYYEQAKSFPTYAVLVGPNGVDATYRALVTPGEAPLAHWEGFAEKAMASSGLPQAKVLSSRIVDVANVRGGRIEAEARSEGREIRQLMYVLPGQGHWAAVVLTADRSEYDRAAAATEAVVPRIQGLTSVTEKPNPGVVTASDKAQNKLGVALLMGAGGGYLLSKLVRRKRPRRA